MGNTAHEEPVGHLLTRQERQGQLVEINNQLSDLLLAGILRIHRLGLGDHEPLAVGICIGQRAFQTLTPEHHDKAMLLARINVDLSCADLLNLSRENSAQPLANLGRNATGATVCDDSLGIEGAEISPCRHVTVLELDAQTQRLDHTSADLPFDGVVTEEGQVSRTRAWGNARCHRNHPSLGAPRLGQGVEVRGFGRLQRRHPILGTGRYIS